MNVAYLETVRLLVQVAPIVFADDGFALKGGTAINLFLRDLPRLSVDLDLVLLDHSLDRPAALAVISATIRNAANRLERAGFEVYVPPAAGHAEEARLLVRRGGREVKVEINQVMRGCLYPVQRARLTDSARRELRADCTLPLLASAEIYGSKLVAAMDRQHPRDLFDVYTLLLNGGISIEMRRAFVAYLACHNRPVHEVLFPKARNIEFDYERTFAGMTAREVPLDDLLATRAELMRDLPASLNPDERAFLRSLVRAEPECSRFGIEHLADLPAMRWKVENLRRLREKDRHKFELQAQMLDERLGALA